MLVGMQIRAASGRLVVMGDFGRSGLVEMANFDLSEPVDHKISRADLDKMGLIEITNDPVADSLTGPGAPSGDEDVCE